MKKIALVLIVAISAFSVLGFQEKGRLQRLADEAAAAEALLGERAGGIVINAPAPEGSAAGGSQAAPLAIPATDSSGAACP
jgi:hypothetical protein